MLLLEKDKMNFLNDYFYSEKKKSYLTLPGPMWKGNCPPPPLLKLTSQSHAWLFSGQMNWQFLQIEHVRQSEVRN